MQKFSKKKFKEGYSLWLKSASKDIAFALNQLKPEEVRSIITKSEQYLEKPESVFGMEGIEAVKKLVPENILLLSTDTVVFSQSIFAPFPSVFDYAVALNRRYYLGSWHSIITLNTTYLKEATEVMLRYVLLHELLQKEIYDENMRNGNRRFTPEEKRKISNDTLHKAVEISGITPEELRKENELILKVSYHSPLIPKPFAEAALYFYMEKNLENFKNFGEASKTKKEDAIGKKLNSDFKGWIDFSTTTYKIFLEDLKKELNYMEYGYA